MGKFNELFRDKNYELVQVHLRNVLGDKEDEIFVGVFKWENNVLNSLDGDCYNPEMEVLEFEEFVNEEARVKNGLAIIVKEF